MAYNKEMWDRHKSIVSMFLEGDSHAKVGKKHMISPSRVDRIIHHMLRKMYFITRDENIYPATAKEIRSNKHHILNAIDKLEKELVS